MPIPQKDDYALSAIKTAHEGVLTRLQTFRHAGGKDREKRAREAAEAAAAAYNMVADYLNGSD